MIEQKYIKSFAEHVMQCIREWGNLLQVGDKRYGVTASPCQRDLVLTTQELCLVNPAGKVLRAKCLSPIVPECWRATRCIGWRAPVCLQSSETQHGAEYTAVCTTDTLHLVRDFWWPVFRSLPWVKFKNLYIWKVMMIPVSQIFVGSVSTGSSWHRLLLCLPPFGFELLILTVTWRGFFEC